MRTRGRVRRPHGALAPLALAGLIVAGCSGRGPSAPAASAGTAIVLDGPSATSPASPQAEEGLAGEVVQVASAALEIPSQSGDGTSIWVARANLPGKLGFVVILDSSARVVGASPADGKPGRIVLDRPLDRSGDLLGVLYADNGDGIVDVDRDAVVISGEEPVSRQFQYRLDG